MFHIMRNGTIKLCVQDDAPERVTWRRRRSLEFRTYSQHANPLVATDISATAIDTVTVAQFPHGATLSPVGCVHVRSD